MEQVMLSLKKTPTSWTFLTYSNLKVIGSQKVPNSWKETTLEWFQISKVQSSGNLWISKTNMQFGPPCWHSMFCNKNSLKEPKNGQCTRQRPSSGSENKVYKTQAKSSLSLLTTLVVQIGTQILSIKKLNFLTTQTQLKNKIEWNDHETYLYV